MDETSLIKWVLGAVAGIGAIMASVVAYLFKAIETANTKRIDQLEADVALCEAKHKECEEKYAKTTDRLSETALQLTEVRVKLGMQAK